MSENPRALVRHGARALAAAAVVAGGVLVASPAQAVLGVPTITSVYVSGSTTNKVVTAGTNVLITGTGFTGMTDNAADATNCNIAPVAYPGAGSGCSQVRFLGVSASATTNFALATRYTILSDTQIYATVPTISAGDGAAGGAVAGTGSIKVQVVNSTGTGTSSGISASTASELFYRKPLTATIATTVNGNPIGGGSLTVPVGGGIANLSPTTFPQEKITAYVYSVITGSPQIAPATVNYLDSTNVTVLLPPAQPAGDFAGIMLVHDGIPGSADVDSLKYPAVISAINSCASDLTTWLTTPTSTLPTCTGPATAPTTGNADFKLTGKGFAGATTSTFNFTATGGTITTTTCKIVSDTLVYCHLAGITPPTAGAAFVTFTPADPDGGGGPATAPVLAPTAGSVLVYGGVV